MTAYEHLALEAALHGGRDRVFQALLAHPLIGQIDLRRRADRPADRAQPRAPARGRDAMTAAGCRPRRPCSRSTRATARPTSRWSGRTERCSARPAAAASGRTSSVPAAAVDGLAAAGGAGCRRGRLARGIGSALVDHVSACLANADLPVEEERLEHAIEARGWGDERTSATTPSRCCGPASTEPRGVAVVCGAGINCVGMLPDGRTAALPRDRADLRRLGRRWPPVAGGDVVRGPRRGRPRRRDRVAGALPGHFGLSSMAP